MEDLTGRQLGPYQIISPIGEGGMASVFKAYHAAMDRYVAVKVLPQHLAKSDPQFIGRFQQEARLLAKLQHPHILPVFDFGDADGYTYLVMPLIETGTLRDLLPSKPLPLKQIRNIVTQVGDALDYAHTRGLVHRDVKPSNVLVDERGNCTLTDFGIAKMVEGTAHFTSTGGIIGTPAYMSPEQGRGLKVDARTDLYSLGVMLYEMATGRVPFDAETPVAVIFMHVQDPLPLPRKINPDLPESVERIILKSLAKDPDDRYQTTKAMVEALQGAVDAAEHQKPTQPVAIEQTNLDVTTLPTAAETKPRRAETPTLKPRRAMPMAALAILGVVVIVIAIGVVFAVPRVIRSASITATDTPPTNVVTVATSSEPSSAQLTQVATSLSSTPETQPSPAVIAYSWDFKQDGEGWARFFTLVQNDVYSESHDIASVKIVNGALTTRSLGSDPYFFSANNLNITASATPIVAIRMSVSAGDWAEIYFITDSDENWSESKKLEFPLTSDGQFHDYLIDMSEVSRWRLTITRLRLDPTDIASAEIQIDYIRVQSP